jgi:peptidoglycan/LPS O-acetylase OafA/YrhL
MTHIDAMRGIASLAVAWFHFVSGNKAFLPKMISNYLDLNGWAGVEMFFVISGFIIPYTLYRANYTFRCFPRFLIKRVIRLDPPYLVTIGIVVGLGYLAASVPGFRGSPYTASWLQVALHLGYVNGFVGQPWLNPVFWTLAIEFQYYVLIGAVFPLLVWPNRATRTAMFAFLATASFLPTTDRFIIPYLPVFLLGVSVFYHSIGFISRRVLAVLALGLTALVFARVGGVAAIVSAIAVVLLVMDRIQYPRLLIGAGTISYSLYLLHVPIGSRIINLSLRLPNVVAVKIAAMFFAMTASIAAAYLLYVVVEKSAQRLSSRISLKKTTTDDAVSAAALAAAP